MSEVYETITLEFDDNTEMECEVIGVFEADGVNYVALIPAAEAELEEAEVLFYRYKEDEEGFELEDIETDDEFEKVIVAFEAAMAEDEE